MRCACGALVEAPDGVKWWHPEREPDPGPQVVAVVRHGDPPEMCRWERIAGGWSQRGVLVDFYIDRTPPVSWEKVGRCWSGRYHAVVAVWPGPKGSWTFDDHEDQREQALAVATDQPSIDSVLLAHRQGDHGKCAKCGTTWPCDAFNEAAAKRTPTDGGEFGNVDLAALLPWRAVVCFTNATRTKRTDRATFCCEDAEHAAEKAVTELEERRRTQADRLGGPEAICGEARIVNPDRETVRTCYLFSAKETLKWEDRTPDEIARED